MNSVTPRVFCSIYGDDANGPVLDAMFDFSTDRWCTFIPTPVSPRNVLLLTEHGLYILKLNYCCFLLNFHAVSVEADTRQRCRSSS